MTTIVKLAGLENPAKVAEIVFPQPAEEFDNILMAVDPLADPPALWVSGRYNRGKHTNLVKFEDRGDKLVRTVDAGTANALSKETGEDGSMDSPQYYIAADKRSGLFAPGAIAVAGA
jgi:hypothetical protein